jgi:hypothetical protein
VKQLQEINSKLESIE